jgi:hypothetical protein
MAKIKLTKKEADRIMKIKGNTIGAILKTDYQFILNKKGKEGVKKVEERLKELGCPINFKKISSFKWYPESKGCLAMLVMLEVFGWDESKASDLGYNAPFDSPVTKFMIGSLLDVEKVFQNTQKYWHRFADFGEMKYTEYNIENKYGILRIENFKKYHPTVEIYINSFLLRLFEILTKSKKVKVEQTKSLFNNDPYDEFKITW